MSSSNLFNLTEVPLQFFKNCTAEDGEDTHDKFIIVAKYMASGYMMSLTAFTKQFKKHNQYKDVQKQPYYREGLYKPRGRKFIENCVQSIRFGKKQINFEDNRSKNSRPLKFPDEEIEELAEAQLVAQDELGYSQFKFWSSYTAPKQISWSNYSSRVKKYVGTGSWSKNKKVQLTQKHKEHRESFGKYIKYSNTKNLYSNRFKQFRPVVFQDESWWPSKIPPSNPVIKHRYDLYEPDPLKKLGNRRKIPNSTESFMFSVAFSRTKKFRLKFFTQKKYYERRPRNARKDYKYEKIDVNDKTILEEVIQDQLLNWPEGHILLWDGASVHSNDCIKYIKEQTDDMDVVETISVKQRWNRKRFKYPSLSPDFNPCENVIAILKEEALNILFDLYPGQKWDISKGQTALRRAFNQMEFSTIDKCIDAAERCWEIAANNGGEWTRDSIYYKKKHTGHIARGSDLIDESDEDSSNSSVLSIDHSDNNSNDNNSNNNNNHNNTRYRYEYQPKRRRLNDLDNQQSSQV